MKVFLPGNCLVINCLNIKKSDVALLIIYQNSFSVNLQKKKKINVTLNYEYLEKPSVFFPRLGQVLVYFCH